MIAAEKIAAAGFTLKSTSAGGYVRYGHPDGSKLWVRPDGEVIRLGPKVTSEKGKKYHPRFDQHGQVTKKHSTGEQIAKS